VRSHHVRTQQSLLSVKPSMIDMKSNSSVISICKNALFAGSIHLMFVLLISFANEDLVFAQPVNEKDYDLKWIRGGTYVVTSNGYNSMFIVTGEGVIVVDAPPTIGDKIFNAISEVTNESVKYLIYSHAHKDHIGGAHVFQPGIEIVAQNHTLNFLKMANNDTERPLPTQIFTNETTITLGNSTVELAYGGPYHQDGNIFVYVPQDKTLMVVDQLSPGGVPWKHLATTPHAPSYIKSYDQVLDYDFDVYVSGHGIGMRDDVLLEKEYVDDLKRNAEYALSNVNFTEATKSADKNNTAAVTEAYFNAMTDVCVDKTDGKWKNKLAAVGVWTDEHCEKMIISLRVD
jgi:glyoxylase-like metal-dependent hydrolase (beta-lactamase superfamily II)